MMLAGTENCSICPSLGFWSREGVAPGLTLAGLAPSRPGVVAPDEVRIEQGGHLGRALRFVCPDDIVEAP